MKRSTRFWLTFFGLGVIILIVWAGVIKIAIMVFAIIAILSYIISCFTDANSSYPSIKHKWNFVRGINQWIDKE